MLKQLLAILFYLCTAFTASAQKADTVANENKTGVPIKPDTIVRSSFAPKIKRDKVYNPDSTHSPRLAVKRSLILPGWGQVYNHKIWKLPIIYGGLGLLVSAIIFNQTNYNEFLALARIKNTLKIPVQGEPLYASYIKYKADYEKYQSQSFESLSNASYGYLRNRDLSILGTLGLWGLQAIDAYIDAKFINSFTVDNDLSMQVTPAFINQPVYVASSGNAYIPGIKITFTLK